MNAAEICRDLEAECARAHERRQAEAMALQRRHLVSDNGTAAVRGALLASGAVQALMAYERVSWRPSYLTCALAVVYAPLHAAVAHARYAERAERARRAAGAYDALRLEAKTYRHEGLARDPHALERVRAFEQKMYNLPSK